MKYKKAMVRLFDVFVSGFRSLLNSCDFCLVSIPTDFYAWRIGTYFLNLHYLLATSSNESYFLQFCWYSILESFLNNVWACNLCH